IIGYTKPSAGSQKLAASTSCAAAVIGQCQVANHLIKPGQYALGLRRLLRQPHECILHQVFGGIGQLPGVQTQSRRVLSIKPTQGYWIDCQAPWFLKAHDHYYDAARVDFSREKFKIWPEEGF